MTRDAWRRAFEPQEHRERVRKTRQWMKDNNVDILVVHSPEHYTYLGGVDLTSIFYYQALFVGLDEARDPVFLANRGDYNIALESSWLDDIRLIWNYDDKYQVTADIITELVGRPAGDVTIGMSLHSPHFKVSDFLALKERLPGATIVDCSLALDEQRIVKSSKEVEYLRYSAFLADLGVTAGINAIRAGARDREVSAAIESTLYLNGGEWRPYPTLIDARGVLHGTPVGRQLKNGDVVYLEVSGNYKRYNCNISRMACVGEPSDFVLEAYRLVREALERGQDAMKPGIPTKKVWEISNAVYPEQFKKYARYRIGFSNELAYPPIWMGDGCLSFDGEDQHILEPGMVVTLEPGFAYFDGLTMELGNQILITDGGSEVLNNTPLDLQVR